MMISLSVEYNDIFVHKVTVRYIPGFFYSSVQTVPTPSRLIQTTNKKKSTHNLLIKYNKGRINKTVDKTHDFIKWFMKFSINEQYLHSGFFSSLFFVKANKCPGIEHVNERKMWFRFHLCWISLQMCFIELFNSFNSMPQSLNQWRSLVNLTNCKKKDTQ